MSDKSNLPGVTLQALRAVLQRLGPVGRRVSSALCAGDYPVLQQMSVDPRAYTDSSEFARAYLAVNLVRKLDCLPTGIDTRAVALGKWLETEEVCRSVNRLGRWCSLIDRSREYQVTEVICLAKKLIQNALGDFNWNDAYDAASFSGGASTRLKRRTGHPFYKIQGQPHVTRKAALLAACAIWHDEVWKTRFLENFGWDTTPAEWLEVVEGARFDTVPKDSKTDRTILIEPDMNMFIQKGIGKCIRRKLRRVGIDLNDQSRNQYLAMCGSEDGSLATIDLASASDSISNYIVKELLPDSWYQALDLVRSERAIIDGRPHLLEKFSSMGNGFTFELESLLFWGLTKACVLISGSADRRIGIYGDDIICHHECVPLLLDVFTVVGFTINESKSFWDGPFRESCGKHYFNGTDVTPFYCKHAIDTPEQKLWLANSWRIWCGTVWYEGQKVYEYLVGLIPECYRNPVPAYMGLKSGIICNLDEAAPRFLRRKQQWLIRVLKPTRRRHIPNGWPAVYVSLWGLNDPSAIPSLEDECPRLVIEKGDVTYRLRRCATSRWDCVDHAVFLPPHLNRNYG